MPVLYAMPFSRRSSRRRRRYRRALGYYRRRFKRRYSMSNSRSSTRVKFSSSYLFENSSGYGETLGTMRSIYPFHNGQVSMEQSQLYRSYCQLYDEVKMIGMKVQVIVTDPVGTATIPSLQIWTAFDRRHGNGEPTPTPRQLKQYALASCATAVNNNVAKVTRSIYASDLIEKAQWVDSDHHVEGDLYQNSNEAWVVAGRNPNFFCPSFHVCFGCPSINEAAQATIHYSLNVTYYVAFRCPKYGGSEWHDPWKDVPEKSAPVPEALDDNVDMDGAPSEDGDVDAAAAAAAEPPAKKNEPS